METFITLTATAINDVSIEPPELISVAVSHISGFTSFLVGLKTPSTISVLENHAEIAAKLSAVGADVVLY